MRTILLIDDDVDMRKKYKKFLSTKGFTVVEAPNALEVANILMAEKSQLDLILLDINIPEVDGRDIFEIINEYAPEIPIIVSSVYPVNEQKFKVPRATDYYSKMQKEEVLLKKINSILGLEVTS